MPGRRRPYRIVFDETQQDGTVRRGTISVHDLAAARHEATVIARDGKPAEIHYVTGDGRRQQLEYYSP